MHSLLLKKTTKELPILSKLTSTLASEPIKELTPVSKLISSYLLKNIIMDEYDRHMKIPERQRAEDQQYTEEKTRQLPDETRDKVVKDPKPVDLEQERIYYAQLIYSRLEEALKNKHLSMFFIPGQNLLSAFSQEDFELSIFYCKLIKHLLNDPNCVKHVSMGPILLPQTEW